MRNKLIYSLTFVGAMFTIASCNDDDEKPASVLGSWEGDKTEVTTTVDGFPDFVDNDENFAGQAEFRKDGTVIFKEDGDITEGTWSQSGNTLTLSVDGMSEEEDMSGNYTIKELNKSRLKIYIEKDVNFVVEVDETEVELEGHVKATLYFNRK